ncbi:TniQ family protein [Paenibacillus oenotherae]|uniref:TniQ family protein n=1 Tax=Paenibacillus oenotherae TaxID=1435645 RepID=A0ABS7D3D6_9BACL|nr:TniQ family protein [Paenibacillus oenotherae]MBW7474326.1 TniQ family protein [Paenibacillus oenotherae]
MRDPFLRRRPVPFPDESIRGYIVRLAHLNRTSPRNIYQKSSLLTGTVPRSLLMITDKVPLSKLQDLTLIEESKLYDLSFYSLAGKYRDKREDLKILRRISAKGFCSVFFSQVCPICLSEKDFHRKLWELRMITTCHLHKCRLVSTCPQCGKILSPYRRFVTYCDCGFDLRKCSAKYVNSSDILLPTYINEKYFTGIKTIHLTEEFQQLSFRHFLYLHIFLYEYIFKCEFSQSDLQYSASFKPEIMHQVSLKTFEIFIGWPKSFYEFIETYRITPKNSSSGITKEFGRFHYQLIEKLSLEEFSFVLNTFVQYCGDIPSDPILKQVKKQLSDFLTRKRRKMIFPFKKIILYALKVQLKSLELMLG